MRARPVRTRADLIALAAQHAPSRACERAVREGLITTHGGFTSSEGLPGWIVEIKSKRDRRWLIAIWCDEKTYQFYVEYLNAIPWAMWQGDSNGERPLIDGDNPREAAFNRMKARRHAST